MFACFTRTRGLALLWALTWLSAEAAVGINVNPDTNRIPISPLIYGSNQDIAGVNFTLRRQGGNRMTGYNWETNASNAGSDYLHQSDDFLTWVSNITGSQANIPGIVVTNFHDQSVAANHAYSIVTLPMAGYVAADKSGPVTTGQVAPSSRWVQLLNTKPTALSLTPDLNDGKVYSDELLNFLVNRYGSATSTTGIKGYALDNEPDLWSSTHARLHPAQPLCAELITRSVDLAKTVKRIDPAAETLGFVSYGFGGYHDFQGAPDWTTEKTKGSYRWFIDYFLDQMKQASTTNSQRLLDVLDLHNYSEAQGGGARVTDNTDYTNIACNQARLQAPRAFWDATYVENSWIGQYFPGFLPFLPNIQQSISTFYPGTKLGFTEYNFGGESHISGGIAQADILGIFGKNSVYLASLWPLHNDLTYTAAAFKLYRNYDGTGQQFGDTSVTAAASDVVTCSTFASLESSSTARLHVVVLNKSYSTPTVLNFTVAGTTPYGSARVFAFDSARATITERAAVTNISGNQFSYTLPALTAAHFVLVAATTASAITTQPVNQTIIAGNAVTFIAAASGSPAPTYQWQKNGVAISGATSSTYTIASVASGDAGSYTVVAANSVGSATSNSATLTVQLVPVFSTQPQSLPAFVGATINFTAVATSSTAITYQWQKNGINIPSATGPTLSLSNVQLTDAGSYAVIATDSVGSSTSRFARLVVILPQSNAITYATTVSSTSVTAGGAVNLAYFMTNVGTQAWGAAHYLSIRDVNNTFVAFSSLIGTLPGETTTAVLNFPAPSVPGTYTYYVQALENGVQFFSTQTTLTLTVLAPLRNSITYNTTTFPVSAAPGSAVVFTYNVTNTGTQTWGANHLLSLKNNSGTTLSSALLTVLAPGASKTVNLSFTAPTAPGTYNYTVQAAQTGVGNFNTQADLTLVVLAPRPNAIVYTRTRLPNEVVPGATLNLSYSLSNAGTKVWATGHYLSLRDENGTFLSFLPLNGIATSGTTNVAFSFTAPITPGLHTYYVQAFEEGIEFFSTQDVVVVQVDALPLRNAMTYNATTFPSTVAPGATVSFTYNLTNRGTKTWGATDYLSFRDVDNTFLGFPSLSGIAPGASKTVAISFTAPTTPGIYTYKAQGLEDGVAFYVMDDTLVLFVQ